MVRQQALEIASREELLAIVIDALRHTLRMSGRDADTPITATTIPIGELPDFDSHNGIEATLAIEERIGRILPISLFVDKATGRPLSIAEVVDRLIGDEPAKED